MKINYLETRAAKVCLPFTAPHTQNRKDVNRISFLNRGYAFNCLVAVLIVNLVFPTSVFGVGVNFPFLDGDVPLRASYGVYISQLIRFARVCNHVTDFNAGNKCLTAKLLQQGYRYHKLRKTFSKFYRRHYQLISKYDVGLKKLLGEGLSEPEFYGDLVYKFKKLIGRNDFSFQFRKSLHVTDV